MFADRHGAGQALAEQVALQVGGDGGPGRPLVLALPRGGVPVAVPVAERLGADLDIVVARKIGAPGRPELGVGAIAEDGPPVFNDTILSHLGLVEDDLVDTVAAERVELDRRVERYRGTRAAPDVAGRVAVVVDDGLATGVTARAALRWLRLQQPRRLMLAVPVCSREARDLLDNDADTVICLHAPERFTAVGQWYSDFGQLSDADVDTALNRTTQAGGHGGSTLAGSQRSSGTG